MSAISYFTKDNVSLREGIELFFTEKENKSKDTANTYFHAINGMSREIFNVEVQYLKKEQIESLTWNVLNKYKLKLKERCSNATVNNRMSAVKSMIKYLTARNIISYNISELDLVEKLNDDGENIERIDLELLMQYVAYFEDHERFNGKEKKWLCLFALETGNRVQELLSAQKNQFIMDGDDYIFKSRGKQRGKGNKEYIERIGCEMYDELMSLNPDSDKVFSITYNAILSAFDRANKYFGNTSVKYSPHSIKHLSVYLEYKFTGDILLAKQKGKHESIDTTMRYLKIEKVPRVGAFTRMSKVEKNAYKESNLEDLISVIDDLPMDVKYLINKKLEELK